MPDLCCEYEFPDFTINDSGDGVDRLVLASDGIVGLDGAPVRRQVDPKGQIDGGIVHPGLFGPRVVTWRGGVNIQSVDWELTTEYLTAINTLQQTVIESLESILNADWVLTWTPTGLSAVNLNLRYCAGPGGEIQFGGSMLAMTWQFTTISDDPEISDGSGGP